jgi:hypothetical protein
MTKLMKTSIAALALIILFAGTASVGYAEPKGVAGSWTLSAEGYVLKMVLTQSGKKITGTLHGPHGPMPLKGEFAKNRITFSAGGPDGIGGRLELSATGVLRSDGTLVGALTSDTSGNLTWKAVRTASE